MFQILNPSFDAASSLGGYGLWIHNVLHIHASPVSHFTPHFSSSLRLLNILEVWTGAYKRHLCNSNDNFNLALQSQIQKFRINFKIRVQIMRSTLQKSGMSGQKITSRNPDIRISGYPDARWRYPDRRPIRISGYPPPITNSNSLKYVKKSPIRHPAPASGSGKLFQIRLRQIQPSGRSLHTSPYLLVQNENGG